MNTIKPSELIQNTTSTFPQMALTPYKSAVANRKKWLYVTSEKRIMDSIQYQFKFKDT
jgi:hypothetical protein